MTSGLLPLVITVRDAFEWKAREEFAEPHEVGGNPIAGYDKAHGEDDDEDAASDARCEALPEDRHAEENSRDRLQGAEDRRGSRADVLDGAGGAEERNGRGEECQREEVAPQVPLAGECNGAAEIQPHKEERKAEKQDVEGHFECGDGFEPDGSRRRCKRHRRAPRP